jgi:hypothetical protein
MFGSNTILGAIQMANIDIYEYVISNIDWIVGFLDSEDDPIIRFELARLEELRGRLKARPGNPGGTFEEDAELELYSTLENHPKLKKAFLARVTDELANQCLRAINYFLELEKTRSLTPVELDRKQKAVDQLRDCQRQHEEGLFD